jgi:large subunit ribosomal protein L10
MALKLAGKKIIVSEVAEVAATSPAVVLAEYRGLTVTQMTRLRQEAKQVGDIYVRVVRNTLAARAFEGTAFDCLKPVLLGPLILVFSRHEPAAAARLVKNFAKTNEKFVVKALAVDGQLLDAKQLDAVASLPTKDESISILMATLKAPITKFVRTLAEPHAKLVRTIAAIRDQKQAAAA